MVRVEMPRARMAMISESDESRPMAMRIPNSSDIGTVKTTMCGSDRNSSRPTVAAGSDRLMIMPAKSKRFFIRMMKV